MSPQHTKLRISAAAMGVALDQEQVEKLLAYQALMIKWNRTYNLTSIRDPEEMFVQHLLDSLVIAPLLGSVKALADVGSGGGLPGIPVAIARPEMDVTLIETSSKKSAFQQQAKIELGLANVSIYSGRVEEYPTKQSFDGVVSRAFSSLADFVTWSGDLLAPGGSMYAMKGLYPEAEVSALPAGWQVSESVPLSVPGLLAQRHLLKLERV